MQQAASLQQSEKSGLVKEMDNVIAQRPEWRFLEQQRHLKDVIRLLLRETQSYTHNFDETLLDNKDNREQALTSSWLSLLISQELQHPPQLTQQAFSYTFYLTLAGDQLTSSTKLILEKSLSSHFSEEGLKTLNTLHQFCSEMLRLQREHFSWDKPWYLTRPCLFFLNHMIPAHWISAIAELMLLLQQHDSLISTRPNTIEFNPQQLHASHPLRKSASEELRIHAQHYKKLSQTMNDNSNELAGFLQRQCNRIPEARHIEAALQDMTEAWAKTHLLKVNENSPLEQTHALLAEAKHQQQSLAHTLAPTRKSLLSSASTAREKELCALIETLFEV